VKRISGLIYDESRTVLRTFSGECGERCCDLY
jgi:hypothetical protein